jgi:hypothetical protein
MKNYKFHMFAPQKISVWGDGYANPGLIIDHSHVIVSCV